MKKLTLISIAALVILSCSNNSDPVSNAIKQSIDVSGRGMVKIDTFDDPIKINDSTFSCTYSFNNTMIGKQVRITNVYYFSTSLETIKSFETQKTEMKSEGDWIEVNLD